MDISPPTYGFAAEMIPNLSFATASRHLGWALILTALLLFLLKPLPSALRFAITIAAFVACIAPAPWSLVHPLGLAYQTPSLVTQGIALLYCLQFWQNRGVHQSTLYLQNTGSETRWPTGILLMAIAAGWALFLDTFAVLPVQLYAMGYGFGVPLFGLMLAVVLWSIARSGGNLRKNRHSGALAVVLLLSVAIFAFTRLPSGNAWDALLDPWLWIAAHAILTGRIVLHLTRRNRRVQL